MIPAEDLEVAVLDRTRTQPRKFRRLAPGQADRSPRRPRPRDAAPSRLRRPRRGRRRRGPAAPAGPAGGSVAEPRPDRRRTDCARGRRAADRPTDGRPEPRAPGRRSRPVWSPTAVICTDFMRFVTNRGLWTAQPASALSTGRADRSFGRRRAGAALGMDSPRAIAVRRPSRRCRSGGDPASRDSGGSATGCSCRSRNGLSTDGRVPARPPGLAARTAADGRVHPSSRVLGCWAGSSPRSRSRSRRSPPSRVIARGRAVPV